MPLLLLAGASLATSYVLFHDSLGSHATHVPLWVLAFSIGVIASVGGSASYLVGDYSGEEWVEQARASTEFVVVGRSEWTELQSELRAARERPPVRPGPSSDWPELLPWEEPAPVVGPDSGAPVAPDLNPPAPMAVSHGIDSLASEVERLVADLESSAGSEEVPQPGETPTAARTTSTRPPVPPAPSTQTPTVPPAVGAVPSPRAEEPLPRPRTIPRPRGETELPTGPRSGSTRPTAPRPPSEETVASEYRALLSELEDRATKATARRPAEAGPSATASADVRCVGCDARVGPQDQGEPCRSCRSPMCPSCRDRSAKEGYRGLCAVCSILSDSARRDDPVRG